MFNNKIGLMKALVIVLSCFVFSISAQPFQQNTISSYINDLKTVFCADLDNDGLVDILSGSTGENNVSWYKNMGNAAFSQQRIISTAINRPESVIAADLDGDGRMDVITGSWTDREVAWYQNLGGGEFSSKNVIYTSPDGIFEVLAQDMDGDGDLDVISRTRGSINTVISIYSNQGSGVFAAPNFAYTKSGDFTMDIDDLDGDGDYDIALAIEDDNDILWLENLGSGSFGASQVINANISAPSSVDCADLDGDGDLDVLVASGVNSTAADQIVWFEQLSNGSFSALKIVNSNTSSMNVAKAVDLDGDGDQDVVSTSFQAGSVEWYHNTGSGNFNVVTILVNSIAKNVWSAHFPDLNNDGSKDILLDIRALGTEDEIAWIGNLGNGSFGSLKSIVSSTERATSVFSADLDGDGLEDVLSSSYADDKIAWYKNFGDGQFSSIRILNDDADFAYSVYATDLDNDGDVDVLSASGGDSKIAWYENLGSGIFSGEQIISSTASGARSVFAADLDGDGDMDVLSASRINDNIDWYENLGGGNFSGTNIINNFANGARSVYAADLDGDGDKDVLSAAWDDDQIAWYENLGSGSFSAKSVVSTLNNPTSVRAADLDGDGDIDVLASSSFEMCWFENLGSATFSAKNTFPGSTSSSSVISAISTADLDLDGDLDVLTATMGSNRVGWHENLGNGSFSSRLTIASNEDAASVWAGDLDGDGDLDILSASWNESRIAWYENGVRTRGSLSLVFCDTTNSYTVPSGLNTYNTTGTYYDTIPNANGGDSVLTINLRFNGVDSVAMSATICAGDTFFVGNSTYTLEGVYVDSLSNVYGCDSVLYTDLDVTELYTSTTVNGRMISADSTIAAYAYQWIDCATGLAIPNATNSSYAPDSSGDYALVVVYNGCADTSVCKTVINDIGLEESKSFTLSLHPNPTSGAVHINFGTTLPNAHIQVRDVSGRICHSVSYNQVTDVELTLDDYAPGLYFIEVETEWGKQVRQVIKE